MQLFSKYLDKQKYMYCQIFKLFAALWMQDSRAKHVQQTS